MHNLFCRLQPERKDRDIATQRGPTRETPSTTEDEGFHTLSTVCGGGFPALYAFMEARRDRRGFHYWDCV